MLHIIVSIKATAKTREKKNSSYSKKGRKNKKSLCVIYTQAGNRSREPRSVRFVNVAQLSRVVCRPTDRKERPFSLSLSLSFIIIYIRYMGGGEKEGGGLFVSTAALGFLPRPPLFVQSPSQIGEIRPPPFIRFINNL